MKGMHYVGVMVLMVLFVALFSVSSGDLSGEAIVARELVHKQAKKTPVAQEAHFICSDPDQVYNNGYIDWNSITTRSTTTLYLGGYPLEQKMDKCQSSNNEYVIEYYCDHNHRINYGLGNCNLEGPDYVCFNGECIPESKVPSVWRNP